MKTKKINDKKLNQELNRMKRDGYYTFNGKVEVTSEFDKFISVLSQNINDEFDTDYSENIPLITVCHGLKLFILQQTDMFEFRKKSSTGMGIDYFIQLSPYKDGIQLYMIQVNPLYRGCGFGSKVLKLLRGISNLLNIPIYLIPVKLQNEVVDIEVLRKFYSKNSYKRTFDSPYWKYDPNTMVDVDTTELTNYKMVS